MSVNLLATNDGDSYLRQDLPSDNQGLNAGMSCQWYQPFLATNHLAIQFTLPATNLGTITRIRLYLYSQGGTGNITDMALYKMSNTFVETTVTYGNAGTYPTLISYIDANVITAGWRYFEIMGAGAVNSQNSLTWGNTIPMRARFVTESGSTKSSYFYTRNEATNVTLRPYMEITYIDKATGALLTALV